jgi:hypothetical protein
VLQRGTASFLFAIYPHEKINFFWIGTNHITAIRQVTSSHLALDLPMNMYKELYIGKATGCLVLDQQ